DDLEILAEQIRAYALLEERDKAIELINALPGKMPRLLAVRLGLADLLDAAGELELALLVFEQILSTQPTNEEALLGAARMHIELFQPEPALRLLQSITPSAPFQRRFALTWAGYHQLVAEYAEAKQFYKDLLTKDEEDDDARLALASVYAYTLDYEKAKVEYAKVPIHSTLAHRARLGVARTLAQQERLQESIEICQGL